MAETIQFQTPDGITIVGDWYEPATDAKAWILLLHMMPADRHSWETFAAKLTAAGYSALAIDERGHGDSTKKGDETVDYNSFSNEEQQEKQLDVDAALEYMESRGATHDRIGVIGGSIGANLAINLGARDEAIKAIGALSPGLDYRGLKTEDPAKQLRESQSLLLAVAPDDTHTDPDQIKILEIASGAKTIVKNYDAGGHATELLENHPELMDELITWLDEIYG